MANIKKPKDGNIDNIIREVVHVEDETCTGGHEMWPINDDDRIIIGESGASSSRKCDGSDVGRPTLTLYVKVGNGIVERTYNADTVFTEDMFRS